MEFAFVMVCSLVLIYIAFYLETRQDRPPETEAVKRGSQY